MPHSVHGGDAPEITARLLDPAERDRALRGAVLAVERRPPRRPSRWQRLLARLRIRPLPQEPEPPEDPYDDATVPSGPPRTPRPPSAEELSLPDEEPSPADAIGREE